MVDEPAVDVLTLVNVHGLNPLEAFAIAEGRTTLAQVQERKRIRAAAASWAADSNNRKLPLTAVWDRDPSNFHWSLDGVDTKEFAQLHPQVTILDVDASELWQKLDPYVEVNRDPWSELHFDKTYVTAYRWFSGLPVTPAYVAPYQGRMIAVGGGMHRLRLARHLGIQTLPFLVNLADVAAVKQLLPSAH